MKKVPTFPTTVNEVSIKIPEGDFGGITSADTIWLVWVFQGEKDQFKSMSSGNTAKMLAIARGGDDSDVLAGIFTDKTKAKGFYDALNYREEE